MAALISQRSRCSQTSKAWRGLLSASVDPHLPPAENHPHAQMASFGVAYSCLLYTSDAADERK